MNIVIIVRNYPPDRIVVSRRWGGLVSELQKNGHHCTIYAENQDDYSFKSHVGSSGEKIFRLPIIKNRSPNHNQVAPQRSRSFIKSFKPVLIDSSLAQWIKTVDVIHESITEKPDLVISSYGPSGPLICGLKVAQKLNVPWICDLRDSFSARGNHKSFFISWFNRKVEKFILKKATLRLTIGENLSKYLSSIYELPFEAIYNGWMKTDLITSVRNSSGGYILYAGSIYEHQIPALRIFLQTLSKQEKIKLKIRLLKDLSGEVSNIIQEYNIAHLVEILPPVNEDIINTELADSFAALVLEDIDSKNPWSTGTVTGKLLGLLASGKKGIIVANKNTEASMLSDRVDGWFCAETQDECDKKFAKLLSFDGETLGEKTLDAYSCINQAKALSLKIDNLNKKRQYD